MLCIFKKSKKTGGALKINSLIFIQCFSIRARVKFFGFSSQFHRAENFQIIQHDALEMTIFIVNFQKILRRLQKWGNASKGR